MQTQPTDDVSTSEHVPITPEAMSTSTKPRRWRGRRYILLGIVILVIAGVVLYAAPLKLRSYLKSESWGDVPRRYGGGLDEEPDSWQDLVVGKDLTFYDTDKYVEVSGNRPGPGYQAGPVTPSRTEYHPSNFQNPMEEVADPVWRERLRELDQRQKMKEGLPENYWERPQYEVQQKLYPKVRQFPDAQSSRVNNPWLNQPYSDPAKATAFQPKEQQRLPLNEPYNNYKNRFPWVGSNPEFKTGSNQAVEETGKIYGSQSELDLLQELDRQHKLVPNTKEEQAQPPSSYVAAGQFQYNSDSIAKQTEYQGVPNESYGPSEVELLEELGRQQNDNKQAGLSLENSTPDNQIPGLEGYRDWPRGQVNANPQPPSHFENRGPMNGFLEKPENMAVPDEYQGPQSDIGTEEHDFQDPARKFYGHIGVEDFQSEENEEEENEEEENNQRDREIEYPDESTGYDKTQGNQGEIEIPEAQQEYQEIPPKESTFSEIRNAYIPVNQESEPTFQEADGDNSEFNERLSGPDEQKGIEQETVIGQEGDKNWEFPWQQSAYERPVNVPGAYDGEPPEFQQEEVGSNIPRQDSNSYRPPFQGNLNHPEGQSEYNQRVQTGDGHDDNSDSMRNFSAEFHGNSQLPNEEIAAERIQEPSPELPEQSQVYREEVIPRAPVIQNYKPPANKYRFKNGEFVEDDHEQKQEIHVPSLTQNEQIRPVSNPNLLSNQSTKEKNYKDIIRRVDQLYSSFTPKSPVSNPNLLSNQSTKEKNYKDIISRVDKLYSSFTPKSPEQNISLNFAGTKSFHSDTTGLQTINVSVNTNVTSNESNIVPSNEAGNTNVTSNESNIVPSNEAGPVTTFPFLDHVLPLEDRVDDLVSRLTLDEIIAQGSATYNNPTPGIERLGIRPFNWITECLHGEMHTLATAFPQAVGLAASFSTDLMFNVSEAISKEVRAQWNDLRKKNETRLFYGVTCFSPTVNILRHPLWGRNQETFGEDPYLTGELTRQYVQGMQGSHPQRMRVAAGCKHFAAHSGPENGRLSFNAKVSKYDLYMTYYPAFKACVEAGSAGLMCSYNRINGIPSCANKEMLTDLARDKWGFKGFVVSDATAVENIYRYHKYTDSAVKAAAAAINAGCNLELAWSNVMSTLLHEAIKTGTVTEETLRQNAKTLFRTRMRLGEFDPPEANEYNNLNQYEEVQSKEHRDLAKQAAKLSFVLMKNDNGFLPIKTKYNKVAVLGPFARATSEIYGSYSPTPNKDLAVSPYDGLTSLGDQVILAQGCPDANCSNFNEEQLMNTIADADVFIVCLGTGKEREGSDRTSLSLPGRQMDLLKFVSIVAKSRPIVLLLFNGGPVDLSWPMTSKAVTAILECWLPAQTAGAAIYETLTGKDTDSVPSARLPMTWPYSLTQVPDIENYSMQHRTYRYSIQDVMFPFGYGLSYSKFVYSNLRVSPERVELGGTVIVSVDVGNIGNYDAHEVVQVYIAWDESVRAANPGVPWWQLVGFKRVLIPVNLTLNVKFEITAQQRSIYVIQSDSLQVLPGQFTVFAGGQQPRQKISVPSNVLETTFQVVIIT